MSIKKFCRAVLLLSCLLFATVSRSQLRKIYLHPKTTSREKQSAFIDSLRFIPLEPKAGIELGAYYNTQVTEKFLMLIDYMNKRLLLYTRDGRFVKNIRYNKLGADFYPSYRENTNQIVFFGKNKNYSLTSTDEIKIKQDWSNPRNRKYFKKYLLDLNDSSLAIRKVMSDEKDIVGLHHYYDDYYLQSQITSSSLYKDSLEHELKLYKNNELVKAFFPYNGIREPRFLYTQDFVATHKTELPDSRILVRPYNDTIYRLVKDSVYPIYQLVLPLENSLPASFFTTAFKNKTDRENFDRNNGWMLHHLYNYYETPQVILLAAGYLSNYESYVYDKQKGTTYKTKNIKPDSSQYNLDVLSDFSAQQQGDRFYKSMRANDLLPFFEQNRNVPVPKELEAFLKSKPPGTTPLIVEFKFKK